MQLEMCNLILLLILSVRAASLPHKCGSWTDVFVKPEDAQDCHGSHPCHSLSEYTSSSQCYFTSNTTVHFLPGAYLLGENITVRGVSNLSLVGSSVNSSPGPSATIQCSRANVGLAFVGGTNLSIQKITIRHCGRIVSRDMIGTYLYTYYWEDITAFTALFVANVSRLTIEEAKVEENTGYGLLVGNMFGDCVVLNSEFLCNNNIDAECYTRSEPPTSGERREIGSIGGNALFLFFCHEPDNSKTSLQITGSQFSRGKSNFSSHAYDDLYSGGGGLGILISPTHIYVPKYITIHLSNSTFDNNVAQSGANTFIQLWYNPFIHIVTGIVHIRVIISSCNFHSGQAGYHGGGLYFYFIIMLSYDEYSPLLDIDILQSNFSDNSAMEGGGIGLNGDIVIVHFRIDACTFHRNKAEIGAGLYAYTSYDIQINETNFSQNVASERGGGVFLAMQTDQYQPRYQKQRVSLANCSFRDCRADVGAAVIIDDCYQTWSWNREHCSKPSGLETLFTFRDVVFNDNRAYTNEHGCTGILHFHNVNHTILEDIQFSNNHCGSVYAFNSNMYCKGQLEFVNNRASSGGAFDLDCSKTSDSSLIYLHPASRLYMANNSALQYGGAIAAREGCGDSVPCFFQFEQERSQQKWKFPNVILQNNTAELRGDSLYIKSADVCTIKDKILQPSVFWSIFKINGANHPLEIATPSYKACLCLGSAAGSFPEWMEEDECPQNGHVAVYRGQSFNITVAGVGQYNYPIPSLLRTTVNSVSGSARLGTRQSAQELSYRCTDVTYSITCTENEVKLYLSIIIEYQVKSENSRMLLNPPTVINATLLPCPFGFELTGTPPTCDCAAPLRQVAGISCDIDTTLVHHPPSMWIGRYTMDDVIVVHRNCPFDYCKPEKTYVNLSNPDEQCTSNRAGILCGACQPGFSLALGTSQCLRCSNIYLLLLIPFLLAGVALVFLLLKTNLTVSMGTINGLIFYANIVRVNHTTFFPHGDGNIFTDILSVFIAWLNLDLGIETCFVSGLDVYTKTWLQFLFPLYIWILVGAMILTSRYSTTISWLTGSNAVPVLATLFLLSYAKLLRSVIATTLFTTLNVGNETIQNVWLLDGNVTFLKGHHIALFLVGMLAVLVYILPFTALVTLSPFLQARSTHKLLRWVSRLKPLVDAYQGPYKDKFRYWTGLGLVVRLVLFAVFAGNALGDPQVNLFAICITLFVMTIYCWNVGKVYKNWMLNTLESFFILNLGVFATATLFVKSSQTSVPFKQKILACVMVGSVFVLFCAVLLYHLYQQVTKTSLPLWVTRHLRKSKKATGTPSNGTGGSEMSPEPPSPQAPTVSTVELSQLSQLREPLLSEN